MSRRGAKIAIAVAATIVVALLYLPAILYGVRQIGFGVATPSFDGIRIEMSAWWVPVSAPGSAFHGLISGGNKQLVFVKARGWLPGYGETIVFSKAKGMPSDGVAKEGKLVRMQMGEILVVKGEPTDPYVHAFALENSLFITATDPSAFRDILRVTAE